MPALICFSLATQSTKLRGSAQSSVTVFCTKCSQDTDRRQCQVRLIWKFNPRLIVCKNKQQECNNTHKLRFFWRSVYNHVKWQFLKKRLLTNSRKGNEDFWWIYRLPDGISKGFGASHSAWHHSLLEALIPSETSVAAMTMYCQEWHYPNQKTPTYGKKKKTNKNCFQPVQECTEPPTHL